MTENSGKDKSKNIIELSDIAVGTSREDEKIIELTEDLVDEARNGISGARLEKNEEASQLELNKGQNIPREHADDEQEIASELEDYFSMDQEEEADFIELDEPLAEPVESPQISITDRQLEAALERVLEKKYRERIETLIDEMIRRKVTEDIESIKDLILKRSTGK